MAVYDGSIRINTEIDTSGIRRGESDVRVSLSRIGQAAKAVKAVLASAFVVGITGALVRFGKECVELGSDLEEVQNVVDVTFTTMSEKVNEFAKNAAVSAGLSETMAKKYVGTFGAMSKSFGFTEQAAYDMATSLTQLSGDVASFYNISQDEAYIKLKSVFTGETETLKDLGVVMTQAALDQYALANGFGKTTSAMTEQEKVALRHQFVMQQLSLASGDFIRTSDSWANQVRIMQLQIQSLKATIGQGLINIFTPVIKVINTLLSKLATVANAFKAFTQLITGKKASSGGGGSAAGTELSDTAAGYDNAAGAADNLANSTGKVAEATKEAAKAAKGYLNPLDKINKISEEEPAAPSSSGGSGGSGGKGGGSGIGGAAIDYGNISQGETVIDNLDGKLNGLIRTISLVKDGFKGAFKANTGQLLANIQRIGEANRAVWGSPEVQAAMSSFKDQAARTLGAVAGSVASVTVSFATGLTGGIAAAKEDLEEFDKLKITSILGNLESGLKTIQDFAGAVAEIATAFESPGFQKIVEILYKISDIIEKIALDWLTGILSDLLNLVLKPIIDNSDKFRVVLEDIFDIVSILLEPIENLWDLIASKAGNYEDSPIHKFFEAVSKLQSTGVGIMLDELHEKLTLVKDLLKGEISFSDFWKMFFNKNGSNQEKESGKEIGGNIISGIRSGIAEKWTEFKQYWQEKKNEIINKFSDVKEKFLSKGREIISGIKGGITEKWGEFKQYWQEKKDSIVNKFNDIKEKFLSKGRQIISGIRSGISEKWSEFIQYWQEKKNSVVNKFSDIKEKFLSKGRNIISGIKSGIIEKWGEFISYWQEKKKAIINKFRDIKEKFLSKGREIISGIRSGIIEKWGEFKQYWQEKKDDILGRFSDIKEKMKEVGQNIVNGIIDGIKSIWDTLTGWAKDIADLFTVDVKHSGSGVTTTSGTTTKPKVRTAEYSPYSSSFSEVPIPHLAKGTVIPPNSEFLAVLGDQKHGTNIEAPLDTIKQANRESILEVLSELGITGNRGNNNTQTIVIKQYLDGNQVAESVVKAGRVRQMATGSNMFMLGTT